jgi:hypothetical protein
LADKIGKGLGPVFAGQDAVGGGDVGQGGAFRDSQVSTD